MDTKTLDNLIIQAIKNNKEEKKKSLLNQNLQALKYTETN